MRKLVVMVTLVALTGLAAADDKVAAPRMTAKVKVYDFTADTVEGSTLKPDTMDVTVGVYGKAASLIRIRKDFVPEIVKSGEDV